MNIHVIIGQDDYLVDEAAKKTVGDGVGLEVIDSLNSTNAELQLADVVRADESFSTPPFLDPRKVTWWKNVHFLPGGRASEDVKKALEKFAAKLAAAKLPDNQHFILSGPHLLASSKFAKCVSGAAEIVSFSAGKPWEAARAAVVRAIDLAGEMGLGFGPGAAERFVSTVGIDARSAASELGKMRDYLGKGAKTISTADVDAITSPGVNVEPDLWSVTDSIGRRDVAAALEAMGRFELKSGFDVLMSTTIERFFRQMLDVAAGRTDGMAPYSVGKLRGFLGRWTQGELRAARARFIRLREKVVSGTESGDVLVVTTLVRVMRGARR